MTQKHMFDRREKFPQSLEEAIAEIKKLTSIASAFNHWIETVGKPAQEAIKQLEQERDKWKEIVSVQHGNMINLKQERDECLDTLEWYADEETWKADPWDSRSKATFEDRGRRARDILVRFGRIGGEAGG